MENTYKIKYQVSSYDVDPRGKARLTAIANYLQETAYKHAHSLGLGFTHLAKEGRAWVLSRLRISIHEYPFWDDEIEVETWPRGIEKLFALRDFRIRSADGRELAVASTCWLMVDKNTHRPVRINPGFIPIETRTDAVFAQIPGKIKLSEDVTAVYFNKRKAVNSDLDVVGHVNNVKFIEWIVDEMDSSLLMSRGIYGIEINYQGEVKLGDEIVMFGDRRKLADYVPEVMIAGYNNSSKAECFGAKVWFFNH